MPVLRVKARDGRVPFMLWNDVPGQQACPHCGAAAVDAASAELAVLKCPRCKTDMSSVKIGGEAMRECEHCGGLWLDVTTFDRICAGREQQAAVLGGASVAPAHQVTSNANGFRVTYAPCPQCGELMNRINFARCSGVIVDVCRGHGTWFDRDELRQIVEFIRGGGLDLAHQKERNELEMERQRLTTAQSLNAPRAGISAGFHTVNIFTDDERVDGLSAARGLLKFLIE